MVIGTGAVAWPPPGHIYITANLKDLGVTALGDLSAGIGLTVPFGSLTRWPNDGPFRTATTFNTLPLLDIKPTLAYKATENLSLGLGADIYTFSGLFGEGQVEKQSIGQVAWDSSRSRKLNSLGKTPQLVSMPACCIRRCAMRMGSRWRTSASSTAVKRPCI